MKYPPADIVEHVLQKAAYSGNHGISLKDIWLELSDFLNEPIDTFLKTIIWQWVFFDGSEDLTSASTEENNTEKDGLNVFRIDSTKPLPLIGDYNEFLTLNGSDESDILLKPNPSTQWKYLTGLVNSKRLKLQLGEFPFQLLCEIARHGSQGILSPDLSKNTKQDPRSLTPRLKKLEDLNLIVKRSFYNEKTKQHTNLCIHRNFVKDDVSSAITGINEDLESSRNVSKTKQYVVEAVKKAPNQLRGFSDLKVDLKLDKNVSSSKFFRSIVEYLDKRGYVERLMVKEAEDKPMVYCIKFLKELPKDYEEKDEFADFFSEIQDEVDVEGDGDTTLYDAIPSINKNFPIQNQFYQLISSCGTQGATSMDIVRTLTGVSDCRPYTKSLDLFTSYVIDHEKLKSLRKFEDEYENYSIVRGYDFEGKYKFYRYFTKENYSKLTNNELVTKKTKNSTKKAVKVSSISSLNKKYFTPLGKITQSSLLSSRTSSKSSASKRKIDDIEANDGIDEPRIKRKMRPKSTQDNANSPKPKRVRKLQSKDGEGASIDSSLESTELTPITDHDEDVQDSAASNTDEGPHAPKTEHEASPNVKILADLKPIHFASSVSLKAVRRRSALLDIIKDQGGVTYTAANLCRLVDEKLGTNTITDKKTLARDVSYLIAMKDVEAEDISLNRSGQIVTRKLLILTDPKFRPSPEDIEEVKDQCINGKSNKQGILLNRRVIEDQVTLFNPTPAKKSNGRLASLKTRGKSKTRIKQEIEDDENIGEENNIGDQEPTSSRRRVSRKSTSKKAKNKDDDIESLQPESESIVQEDLSAYLPKKRKSRAKQPTKYKEDALPRPTQPPVRFRVRGENKFDQVQATTLYRAVVISRSFRRGPIDFESISQLFKGMHVNEVRRKWTSVRKVAGGLSAVMRGIRVFERIITRAIEDGTVTSQDLLDIDYEFLLSIWEEADNSILEGLDTNPFYSTIEGNVEDYDIPEYKDYHFELFEQLEDNSMRQKETLLAATTFFFDEEDEKEIIPQKDEDLRTTLKATFATSEENFSGKSVSNILAEFGESTTQEVINVLIKEKEISYHPNQESDVRFVLTERFNNALYQKVFNTKFFQNASQFEENLYSVIDANKGLILSQGIASGEVASLLNMLMLDEGKKSDNSIKFTRVDKPYVFSGYESRLIDKSKLSCDIIVSGSAEKTKQHAKSVAKVEVPTGKACSHIWLDLNGSINTKIWVRIIISILYHVTFRPGISRYSLYSKLKSVLSVKDFHKVIEWLEKSKVVKIGPCDSLQAINEWFSILGH